MSHQSEPSSKKSTPVLKKLRGWLLYAVYRLAPARVGPWLTRLFFRPAIARQSIEEQDSWKTGTAFEFVSHGRRIQGRYWGHGPGVLLVHGWDGRGSQFHRLIEPIVQSGHRAIAFDAPAHGDSDGEETNFFEYTDAIRHLLRGDSGMPVSKVVAHSFGAGATLNALDKESTEVELLLIAPAFRLQEYLHDSFRHHGIPLGLLHGIIGQLESRFGYEFNQDNPLELLKRIKQGFVILHDELDRMVPFRHSEEAAEQHALIALQPTRDLGHTRILRSDTAIAALNGYLLRPVREAS